MNDPLTFTTAELAVAIGLNETATKADIIARVHAISRARSKGKSGRTRMVEAFKAEISALEAGARIVRLSAGHGLHGRARVVAAFSTARVGNFKIEILNAARFRAGQPWRIAPAYLMET